ncbi:hypothetical protein [Kineobactrum salinum]|uniref:hypothetical protein n=1 Tax=Kineobactrum salinum TaxID=2708301 RepID=UPI001E646B83|nr:hypothetical protein [Kineobactrum salinum]
MIAFILLVALAPLSHFVPSKRQRRQAQLREAAALAGLFVEFRPLPGSGPDTGNDPPVIYYGLRLAPSPGRGRRRSAWLRQGDNWRGVASREVPPAPLQGCPPPVLAASIDEASCGIYWREDGDTATVAVLRDILQRWQLQLDA